MQLRHLSTLMPPVEGTCRVTAVAWSPNNRRLAVVTVDRVVHLFDENGVKQDKFSTKPAAGGPRNYVVRDLCFSPDSSKLAVAQSDNIVFVYKLGLEWGDRKSICNKFPQSSPVTCLIWPNTHPNDVVFGLAEGKVKAGLLKSNKPATLHSTDSYVTALACSPDGSCVLSAHLDGSIIKYSFEDGGPASVRFANHDAVPYALAWGQSVCAAGNDGRVVFYDDQGGVERVFDYSSNADVREFTTAASNPTGESIVLGNYNSFFVFRHNARQRTWEEVDAHQVENLYSVTALAWKADGSRLAVGALCGVLDLYDACVRRYRYKGKFEFTYVSQSQVIVKRLSSGARIVLRSHYGCEITKINVFQDRYLVANTSETLLVGELESCKLSEVQWQSSGGEKYVFDNPSVCTVYQNGQLSLIEYGRNELLGSVRTEHISAHLLSVCINERPNAEGEGEKKIAFLLDVKTINVKDLTTQVTTNINHDSRIDFLELNARGTLLLYRDKRRQLHLYDIESQTHSTLLNYCNYVQWVPESDVVVAQNRNNLCVWYNIQAPDKVTVYQIAGDVAEIERANGETVVIVDEGMQQASYTLDEQLIAFGAAMEDKDLRGAMQILERSAAKAAARAAADDVVEDETAPTVGGKVGDSSAMWQQLMATAMEENKLVIAERCAAALGDVAKARYLRRLNKFALEAKAKMGGDGYDHWMVRQKMAQLRKDFRGAEDVLLGHNETDEAIEMYQTLHQYEDAINVAERRNHPEASTMRQDYFQYLLDSGQEEVAASLKEREGDYASAIRLYLKGGLPAKAAKVVNDRPGNHPSQVMEQIAAALCASGMYDKAGEFFERMEQLQRALDCYTKGHAYRRAVDLARRAFPTHVMRLEEDWGDYLVQQKQVDMAINHYIEANVATKAIDAALNSRQWAKAAQLVETIDEDSAKPYFRRLARHYEEARKYTEAERYFCQAGLPQEAVEMHTRAGRWEAAHKLASTYMSESDVGRLYINQAQNMEQQGKLKEAERAYITVDEADLAIAMYKKLRKFDDMIRLVRQHRPELLTDTHLHLAQQLEMEGAMRDAEQHYVDAQEWLSAVNMYQSNDMWDEAIRVAKLYGGLDASKRVAFAWARKLGGDAGSKLLAKLGLMSEAIDHATERGDFDYALELAQSYLPKKIPEVRLKHALTLEDADNFRGAEEKFIQAGKPREAIDMYLHQHDWPNALRVAEQYDPSSVPDVFEAEGRAAAEKKDFPRAESLFLSAQRPERALQMYQEQRMWPDATRVAKRHLPHKLNDVALAAAGQGGGLAELQNAGRLALDSQQYSHAINAYLKITPEMAADNGGDVSPLVAAWEEAVRIASNHERSRFQEVASDVAMRLIDVERHERAGDLLSQVDRAEEAIDCFMDGNAWDKARALAQQSVPRMQQVVEKRYRDHLAQSENAEGLVEAGNVTDGLDMFAQRGEWEKLFKVAANQGTAVTEKYSAGYAEALLDEGKIDEAVNVLARYGAAPLASNFALFKRVCRRVLFRTLEAEAEVGARLPEVLTNLRETLFKLVNTLQNMSQYRGERGEFEQLLLVTHYLALRHVAERHDLPELAARMSVSLLRYCGLIPADKAFYLAGTACREVSWNELAFVCLNRYLDISDAIEDPDSPLDNADFENTDVPAPDTYDLPKVHYANEAARDNVRDWVLATAVDRDMEQALPVAPCECGEDVYEATLECPECHTRREACIVSGYPVPRSQMQECKSCGCHAHKQHWNRFVASVGTCPWCQASVTPSY